VLNQVRIPRLIPFVLLFVSLPALASAQIYSWRDADGNRFYSDKAPRGGAVRSYTVAGAPNVRVTRPAIRQYVNRFDDLIEKHAEAYLIPSTLVRAVVQVESGFNPLARSPKGALGLMQLMPGTARDLGVWNPFDPDQNIRGGVAYLRQLLDKFGGNQELALAAYNAGPEAVGRYGNQVPPYAETRNYLQKIRSRTTVTAVTVGNVVYYKWTEINKDGQPVFNFTDKKPSSGDYDIVYPRR
jgi:soluble lytic murein transglycosylase-like protein